MANPVPDNNAGGVRGKFSKLYIFVNGGLRPSVHDCVWTQPGIGPRLIDHVRGGVDARDSRRFLALNIELAEAVSPN